MYSSYSFSPNESYTNNNYRSICQIFDSPINLLIQYVNKLDGTKSPRLIALTKQIFAWCLHRQIRVSAQHLPGKENLTAEFLSRHLRDMYRTDWMLNGKIFKAINQYWGPLEVDLFVTRFSPVEPILQLESRSRGLGDRCVHPTLDSPMSIRSPPMVLDLQSTNEDTNGRSHNSANHPSLESTTMVSGAALYDNRLPNISTGHSRPSDPFSEL